MKLNLDVIRFKLFGYIVVLNLRVWPSKPLPYSFGYWRMFRALGITRNAARFYHGSHDACLSLRAWHGSYIPGKIVLVPDLVIRAYQNERNSRKLMAAIFPPKRHYRVSPIVLYAPISHSRMFARCVKTADDRYRTASSPNVWRWRKRFAYSIYPLVSYCVHLTSR